LNEVKVMLFHVSEESGIERFEPRASEYTAEPVVWAIQQDRLPNYLVPRDCPRVTFYAGVETSATDAQRFLGSSKCVIALESAWYERLKSCCLYCYQMPAETFECIDVCAGYFVSKVPVTPLGVEVIDDVIMRMLGCGGELRFVSNLWPLRDAVVASTLQFSIIRMRNALARTV
jgi:hypothetical protein